MGNMLCSHKPAIINSELTYLYIFTDNNGMITDVSDETLTLLKYEYKILIGKFIGILMSPFMNFLHKNVYFAKYNTLSPLQKNIVHTFLSGIATKRPLIIYDINGQVIYVQIHIKLVNHNRFMCKLDLVNDISNNNIYICPNTIHNCIEPTSTGVFKETINNVIIISINFKDATDILLTYGDRNYIDLHNKFYNDIILLIKQFYYPYIYIYEIFGDCFTFILNADWTYNLKQHCASLAFVFINHIYEFTYPYIQFRVGVICDKLLYGHIGHHFRLFGKGINKVSKLSNICQPDQLCCNHKFFRKLVEENIFGKNNTIATAKIGEFNKEISQLGDENYYTIDIDKCNYNNIFNY